MTTYSIVNSFPQQGSSFVVNALDNRPTTTFVSNRAPISSSDLMWTVQQPAFCYPATEPFNPALPPQQVPIDESSKEPPTRSSRNAVASELFSLLQRDTVAETEAPVSHAKVHQASRSRMKIDVPVEIHAPPSIAGRSHHSPPASPFAPRPTKQTDFDEILEAPLPDQTQPQPIQLSEEDPVELVKSRDPQVIHQQQLLWEEAKRRMEVSPQPTMTPPLPTEPYPDAPSPPKYPALSSPI